MKVERMTWDLVVVVCGMWELHPPYITIVQVRDSEVKSINTHFITLVSVEGIVALATAGKSSY